MDHSIDRSINAATRAGSDALFGGPSYLFSLYIGLENSLAEASGHRARLSEFRKEVERYFPGYSEFIGTGFWVDPETREPSSEVCLRVDIVSSRALGHSHALRCAEVAKRIFDQKSVMVLRTRVGCTFV